MKTFVRLSILCLCLSGVAARGGVREDFPDFFPAEPDSAGKTNGWDLLPSLKEISAEDREGLPEKFVPEQLSRLDAGKARALAARFAENLRLLERIMDAPLLKSHQWRTFRPNDSEDSFVSVQAAMTAKVMLYKAVADARGGSAAKGVEAGLRVIRFGLRACEAEPLLVDLAVNSTMMMTGAGTVATMAAIPGMDGAALRKAAKDLDACDTAGPALRKGLRGEARWSLLLNDPLLQGGEARKNAVIEFGISHAVMSDMLGEGAKEEKAEPVTAEALREKWKKALPESVKAALRDAEKIDWRAYTSAQAGDFRALMKADHRSFPAFQASFHPPDTEAAVKGTIFEAWSRSKSGWETEEFFMHLVASASARIRQARAILLLRAFQLDQGRLPATLEELTPGYWPSVPVDPFDGKPMRYDASKRMVWCTGLNLKDDKGTNTDGPKGEPDDLSMTLPEIK